MRCLPIRLELRRHHRKGERQRLEAVRSRQRVDLAVADAEDAELALPLSLFTSRGARPPL